MPSSRPTYAEFIEAFPAFVELQGPVISNQLSMSSNLLDEAVWGDSYNYAVCLDAAHNLVLMQIAASGQNAALQGAAGPLVSVSGGGISTSFANPTWNQKSQSENWYMKTVYGQQFLRLRSTVVPLGSTTA